MIGRFVRAVRSVQNTCFILGTLWGLMKVVARMFPYFNKARSFLSAVFGCNLFLCLRDIFGEPFWPIFIVGIVGIETFPAFSIPYAMICISQVCLGSGVCILFHKGTSAY